MESIALATVSRVFVEAFGLSCVPDGIAEMKMGDIPQWDSVGNFNFLLLIEQEFQVSFSAEQLGEINSVQSLLVALGK